MQNSKSLRRLASDHANLHTVALPPYYLFPADSSNSPIPDDLTQLSILLTGPAGTPYSGGLWRLYLKIPTDYPHSPPKASFRTKIWHPNVEEKTGAVCVDTLKRDWNDNVTLRDILITISCLLIQPNPDSALNSAAGALLQDDFEEFAKQAKLMTSIHAPISADMKDAVREARRRGEDEGVDIEEDIETRRPTIKKGASSTSSVVMKKKPQPERTDSGYASLDGPASSLSRPARRMQVSIQTPAEPQSEDEEIYDEEAASKENDPSLSPSPVSPAPPSPRKNVLGKRPLSDLPTPKSGEYAYIDDDEEVEGGYDGERLSSNDQNIAANAAEPMGPPARKSPKLTERLKGVNASGRIRSDASGDESNEAIFIKPYDDASEGDILSHDKSNISRTSFPDTLPSDSSNSKEGKENPAKPSAKTMSNTRPLLVASSNKLSGKTSIRSKEKARTGLKRL